LCKSNFKRSESKNHRFWIFKPQETASFHERTDRKLTVTKPVIWVFPNPSENHGYISEAGSLENFFLEPMTVMNLKDWLDNPLGRGVCYVPPSDNRPTWVNLKQSKM
jgi:hypothetical protein